MSKFTLYTKSVVSSADSSDGIRICVMRRIKPEYKFDIWMPILGPSSGLLNKYIVDSSISWTEFSGTYLKQLLRKRKFLELILFLLSKSSVTLLCIEKKANKCHRYLLSKECEKLDAKIKIEHR